MSHDSVDHGYFQSCKNAGKTTPIFEGLAVFFGGKKLPKCRAAYSSDGRDWLVHVLRVPDFFLSLLRQLGLGVRM